MKPTFPNIFNEYVKRVKERKPPKAGGEFRIKPSSLGTNCMRKLAYDSARIPEQSTMPIKNQRIALMGDYVEMMLVEALREAKVLVDYRNPDGSIPLKDGKPNLQFPISSESLHIKKGFIDIVCILQEEKQEPELWIGDTKSIKDDRYKALDLKSIAKDYRQLLVYLYVFNKMLGEGHFDHIPELLPFKESGAKGMRLWYYNKNDSYSKEIVAERDHPEFIRLVDKIQATKEAWETKKLPPKTPEFCSTCGWKTNCDQNSW